MMMYVTATTTRTEIMTYMNNNIDDLMLYAITHYCPDVMVCAAN